MTYGRAEWKQSGFALGSRMQSTTASTPLGAPQVRTLLAIVVTNRSLCLNTVLPSG